MKDQSNKFGRPSDNFKSDQTETMQICTTCLSEVAPGKGHFCQKIQKRENLVTLIKNCSEGSKSSVLAAGLRHVAENQGESTRGGTITLQSGSHAIPVQIGIKRTREITPKFSHENLKRLQAATNLSDKSLL